MGRILDINEAETTGHIFLREKVSDDVHNKVDPFHQSLISKREIEDYLKNLANQYPDKDVPVVTWRFNEVYPLLKQAGGVHLRYNATVKGKTVNLNMWVMRNHDMYLAMPRGQLIEEWRAQVVT